MFLTTGGGECGVGNRASGYIEAMLGCWGKAVEWSHCLYAFHKNLICCKGKWDARLDLSTQGNCDVVATVCSGDPFLYAPILNVQLKTVYETTIKLSLASVKRYMDSFLQTIRIIDFQGHLILLPTQCCEFITTSFTHPNNLCSMPRRSLWPTKYAELKVLYLYQMQASYLLPKLPGNWILNIFSEGLLRLRQPGRLGSKVLAIITIPGS